MAQVLIHTERCTNQRFMEPLSDSIQIPLEMVLIQGGTFQMGSPETEIDRQDNEILHDVTVPTCFMGRYPITQEQWRIVAGWPQVKIELSPEPSDFEGKDLHPVENVNWFEAVEFCDRLSVHTQRQYRLPSEAEWEYACRAGTTTPFHCGETLSTEIANYYGESVYGEGMEGIFRGETTPVNQFVNMANPWGLCDMHGNVDEWCLDAYGEYDSAPKDGSAKISENDNDSRIIRGGAWSNPPRYCRSASRYDFSPEVRGSSFGFRVVVSPRGSS